MFNNFQLSWNTAKNHIKDLFIELNNAKTHKELQNKYNIKWYHSTERSPQHNGVIERIVQTIKRPLYKVLNIYLDSELDVHVNNLMDNDKKWKSI